MAYFEPTSSERRGLIVLGLALLLLVGVGGYSWLHKPDVPASEAQAPAVRTPKYYAVPERQVEAFAFDPNTADSTTLLRLGFAPFQVRGIYKYRAMGGRYHEVDDVSRIPGMTNEQWDRLRPYVRIDRRFQYVKPRPRTFGRSDEQRMAEAAEERVHDTVRFPVKLAAGVAVALNEADTNMLKRVPGIGSFYARQIVRYREQLGGYVSLAQLQEIDGMPEGVEQWLRLDTTRIRRIDVNHASKNQLVRHPYLRVYRASAIWNRLHNQGPLRSIDDLRSLPDFTDSDVERLRPYLVFN